MSDFQHAGSLVKGFLARVQARQAWEAENNREVLHDRLCPSRSRTLAQAWNEALEEDHQRELRRERQISQMRQEVRIPAALRDHGVPDVAIQALTQHVVTPAWEAVDTFLENGESQVLALLGTVGTGKTVAGARVLAWAIRRDIECHFVRATTLARLSAYDDKALFERLCWAPVVVLDDFGTEHQSAFGASLFSEWLDCRYSRAGNRTVITANLQVSEFQARIGERAFDRIRQVGMVKVCKGASMRRREVER